MRTLVTAILLSSALLCPPALAGAQTIGQVFDGVNGSVVVIRARGQDAPDSGAGLIQFSVGGDIILKMDGIALTTVADLVKVREHLGSLPSGKTYGITVLRGGKVLDLTGRVP